MTSSQKWQLKSQNVEDVIFEEIKLRELSFTHVLLTPITIQLHCKLYKFTWDSRALPTSCHWGATERSACCRRSRRSEERDTRLWATTKFFSSWSWPWPQNNHFRLGLKLLLINTSACCKEQDMNICNQQPERDDAEASVKWLNINSPQ